MQHVQHASDVSTRKLSPIPLPSEIEIRRRVDSALAADQRVQALARTNRTAIANSVIHTTNDAVRSGKTSQLFNRAISDIVASNYITEVHAQELRRVIQLDSQKKVQQQIAASPKLWGGNALMSVISHQLSTVVLPTGSGGDVAAQGDFGDGAQIIIGAASLGAAIGGAEGLIPGAVIGGVVGAVVAVIALAADNAGSGESEEGSGEGTEDEADEGGGDSGGDTGN